MTSFIFKTTHKEQSVYCLYCPNCGKEISQDSNFCPYCAKPVVKVQPIQPTPIQPIQPTIPKISHTKRNIGIIIFAVAIILIIIVASTYSNGSQIVNPIQPAPTAIPAPNYTILAQSSYRTTVGGILGIGGNVVCWIQATVQNTGNAAGECTVAGFITDSNNGYSYTQSTSVYLAIGQSQTVTLEFSSGPHNDAYTWTVSAS